VPPPLTIVEPSALTVWQVIRQLSCWNCVGSLSGGWFAKSSGAAAPGWMRSTRPRLLDQ